MVSFPFSTSGAYFASGSNWSPHLYLLQNVAFFRNTAIGAFRGGLFSCALDQRDSNDEDVSALPAAPASGEVVAGLAAGKATVDAWGKAVDSGLVGGAGEFRLSASASVPLRPPSSPQAGGVNIAAASATSRSLRIVGIFSPLASCHRDRATTTTGRQGERLVERLKVSPVPPLQVENASTSRSRRGPT